MNEIFQVTLMEILLKLIGKLMLEVTQWVEGLINGLEGTNYVQKIFIKGKMV